MGVQGLRDYENLLVFQRVPSPPEAPRAEIACAPPFIPKFLLAWRKTVSSILVSWMRSMSGASILLNFSLLLLWLCSPYPYSSRRRSSSFTFVVMGSLGALSWFSSSSGFLPIVSQGLAGCPEACLCRFLVLFFPVQTCGLLWIFWERIENLLFLLLPLSPPILGSSSSSSESFPLDLSAALPPLIETEGVPLAGEFPFGSRPPGFPLFQILGAQICFLALPWRVGC
jgi:hypothetical protein